MKVTVSDIINVMESIAPLHLAESWDNSGLQIGNPNSPVKKVWIALDATIDVVRSCCDNNVDLLITHHPLFFGSLKRIDLSVFPGAIIKLCCDKNLSIYSAHTNYDIVDGGINDILSEKLGLENSSILTPVKGIPGDTTDDCKIVVYAPADHKDTILKAFFESGCGIIGKYTCCTFLSKGTGTYRPDEDATPYAGKPSEISYADEVRIESVVKKSMAEKAVQFIKEHHPYEEMAYDIYPLVNGKKTDGIGRIGELTETITLKEFAEKIKTSFGLKTIKMAGRDKKNIRKVALCSGSGSSLLTSFIKSGADVYVSGDLKYHDARIVEDNDLGLIDIGHFPSEIILIEELCKQIKEKTKGINVSIEKCDVEKDPFDYF